MSIIGSDNVGEGRGKWGVYCRFVSGLLFVRMGWDRIGLKVFLVLPD